MQMRSRATEPTLVFHLETGGDQGRGLTSDSRGERLGGLSLVVLYNLNLKSREDNPVGDIFNILPACLLLPPFLKRKPSPDTPPHTPQIHTHTHGQNSRQHLWMRSVGSWQEIMLMWRD